MNMRSDDPIKFKCVFNISFDGLDLAIPECPEKSKHVMRIMVPLEIHRDTVESKAIELMFVNDAPPLTNEILAGVIPRIGELLEEIIKGRKPDHFMAVENGNFDAAIRTNNATKH